MAGAYFQKGTGEVKNKPQAVIDLGSHSVLLLIARKEKEKLKPLFEDFAISRLGRGLERSAQLTEQRQTETLNILRRFKQKAQEFDCRQIDVIATEAMRRARNARQFKQRIEQELQLQVKILSPEQEAVYSYLGAISVIEEFENQSFTVIDVGGGSTEITLGRGGQILQHASVPVGAARLAESINFKVKLCSSDRMGLMQIVKDELEKLSFWNEITPSRVLVGSGGTITTLAAVFHQMKHYDAQIINRTVLDKEQIWQMYYRMNEMNLAERLKLAGLEAGREDVITYGMIIYLTIMELRQLPWIRVSAGGVRYGYLLGNLITESGVH